MPEFLHQSLVRTACAALVVAGSLASQGCLFGGKKQPKPFVPPPVYAKDPVPPKPVTLDLPPLAGDGPVVQAGVDDPAVGGLANLPVAPPKPAVVKPTPPAKPPATVVDVTPPPAVVPPPQPTAIFSAAEKQRMNQEIDQSLGKVRGALARVEGRNLSADLAALANNARTFMLNAEQTRVQDLVTAVSLAKRAESFATDLVQRLP